MDDIFKRNIRMTLIFMLAGTIFTGLNLIIPAISRPPAANMFGVLFLILNTVSIMAATVSGSFVIRKLPLKRVYRLLLFVLYLILYLALCWAWHVVVFIWCMMIYRIH